jgi:two-component system sensor histidine kinase UhpB
MEMEEGARTMSLRFRLIVSIVLVLVVSLAFGGALACWHAGRSVRTEMRAALAVGEQTVRNALASLPAAGGTQRHIARLVGSFDGDRHVQAALLDDRGVSIASSALAMQSPAVPEWFHGFFGVDLPPLRIPLPADAETHGSITLRADSHNEVGEVWSEFRDALLIVALFGGPTVLLIYWTLGRALWPLASLSAAFGRIGSGDYGPRLAEAGGPPELTDLAAGFNVMAERLAAMEVQNRSLNERLLTLLEEERSDLARDLHDEVGPFLFAVNIDVATIHRLIERGQLGEVPERLHAISEAVGHMQKHVKAILLQLRPIGLVEFGLAGAIDNLAKFWRFRHPEIDFVVDVSGEEDGFGDPADTAIYRIVQESLSNAVRHGRPSRIEVSVSQDAERAIVARVSDDGTGLAETEGGVGFGLLGMRERVAALGGSLVVENGPGTHGLTVTARLPQAFPADAA